MSTIRAVLFDMDGLLVDSERIGIRASVRAGKALGYPVDEALAMQMLGLTREGSAAKYRAAIPGMDVEAFHAAFVREMEDEIEREGITLHAGRTGTARLAGSAWHSLRTGDVDSTGPGR